MFECKKPDQINEKITYLFPLNASQIWLIKLQRVFLTQLLSFCVILMTQKESRP